MNIRDYRGLRAAADQRLGNAPNQKKIVLLYSGLVLGLSGLVTVLNLLISLGIDRTGGLSNLGSRSTLSALQTMLPIAQSLVAMCLEVGYLAAMLRAARGQYTSVNTLRLGFDRFWTLLRLSVLEGLIYLGVGFASIYGSVMVYMLTPLSRPVMELLLPAMEQTSILSADGLVIDEGLYDQLVGAMGPLFLISALVFCAAAAPIAYQYRMARYVVIDKPGLGAAAALKESRRMMRRNRISLFLLDIKQWPYYLALLGATVVGYGDTILGILGVALPISPDWAYLLFTFLYLGLVLLLYTTLRNRVETVYALAYDALRPQENQTGGIVLGNIFDM